ncbi:Ig-like domain-containing protein [Pseudomonas purpurea]|uniref:Ig-like domain-containing protein n=1 Tax=Pseudomonas purpurea TaxID=3136737 RepID=UPI00326785D3
MTTDTKVLHAPVIDEPRAGATVENKVRFKGTGEAGATVQITTVDGNHLVLKTVVSADGSWAGTAPENLPTGLITVSALQTLHHASSPASRNRKFTVK